MRPLVLACLVVVAGCQPLYGPVSEVLHDPTPKNRGKDVATVEVPTPHYIEDCSSDFHRDARTASHAPARAQQLVGIGDDELASATRAPEAARPGMLAKTVELYSDALRADHYNAEATLRLALAYDKVLRKGCALAMLRRLESLTLNPKFATEAQRQIDVLVDNKAWFKGYRRDAMTAVNRAGTP